MYPLENMAPPLDVPLFPMSLLTATAPHTDRRVNYGRKHNRRAGALYINRRHSLCRSLDKGNTGKRTEDYRKVGININRERKKQTNTRKTTIEEPN
jgi:hypothetical protein